MLTRIIGWFLRRRQERRHVHRFQPDETVGWWKCGTCGERLNPIEEVIPVRHEHAWREDFPGSAGRSCACGERRNGLSAEGTAWPL